MIGQQSGLQEQLFYEFRLDGWVPVDHPLRKVDVVLDLGGLRHALTPFYRHTGRPSIDPELMLRMLLVGYCYGLRSERRLCEETHLNLAYRWFVALDWRARTRTIRPFPRTDTAAFVTAPYSVALFEEVVARCRRAELVGGEGFAIDASVIEADASSGRKVDCRTHDLGGDGEADPSSLKRPRLRMPITTCQVATRPSREESHC